MKNEQSQKFTAELCSQQILNLISYVTDYLD